MSFFGLKPAVVSEIWSLQPIRPVGGAAPLNHVKALISFFGSYIWCLDLRLSFSRISSDCEGNLGSIVHRLSSWYIHSWTGQYYLIGILSDVSRNSRAFQVDNTSGIGSNCKQFAFACTSMFPLDNALSQVLHTHCLPSTLM